MTCGVIFGYHNLGVGDGYKGIVGTLQVDARDTAEHPRVHRAIA